MSQLGKHICVVLGKPKGFTRSVLDALLKRGSRVVMSCSDPNIGHSELERYRNLYGPEHLSQQLKFSTLPTSLETLENVFLQAEESFGNVNLIVNSRSRRSLDFDSGVQTLALKYMSGGERFGGILINVQSNQENETEGVERNKLRQLGENGVKVITIVRPGVEYHDSEQIHITDDQHSPYTNFNKTSHYVRDYTGYMALHTALNSKHGAVWKFDKDMKLEQVLEDPVSQGGVGSGRV